MKKYKYRKIIAFTAVLCIGLSLVSCGQAKEEENSQTVSESTAAVTEAESDLGLGFGPQGPEVPEDMTEAEGTEPQYTAVKLTEGLVEGSSSGINPDEQFLQGVTGFSLNLLKQCMKNQDKQNYMISPISLEMALAMAANGAEGQTKLQMEQVLWGGKDIDLLNGYLSAYADQLTDSNPVKFKNANALWIYGNNNGDSGQEKNISVKEDYLKQIAAFNSEVYQAPFDDTTITDINHWVDYNTDGMIPSLIDRISEDARMYILNAIAFEGRWAEQFKEGQVESGFLFSAADGSSQSTDGMSEMLFGYLEDSHASGFIKPYEGGRYAFAAILPEEGMSPEAYLEGITPEAFTALLKNAAKEQQVLITMPKFKADYSVNMNEMLANMGMEEAFSDTADFSRMADTADGPLKIENVLHKTYIEVDENGTRAAAATAIEMDLMSGRWEEDPREVVLNRPFVYAIVDLETTLPIFIGVLNTLE